MSFPSEWDDGGPIGQKHHVMDPFALPFKHAIAWARITEDDKLRAYALGRRRGIELSRMRYRDYLQTTEWKATRRAALDRAKWACQDCQGTSTKLEVHHLDYNARGDESEDDLVVLCDHCHDLRHRKTS